MSKKANIKLLDYETRRMTTNQVILFCGLCFESLWSTFRCLHQSEELNVNEQVISGIDEYLDAIWDSLLDNKRVEVPIENHFEDYLSNLENEVDWGIPAHVACHYILSNAIDVITGLAERDVEYLKEYVPYRNIDFIGVWEENIEDEYNRKSKQIKQLYDNEFTRQIDCIRFLLAEPDKKSIIDFREKLKKTNLTIG